MRDFSIVYMEVAKRFADLSRCNRSKVGAVIIREGNILSFGYNGTPTGFPNDCEDESGTRREVIHAEANAILKCAASGHATKGAAIYITTSPCIECAKMIIQAGIARMYFGDLYRDETPLVLLERCGVITIKI